MSGKDPQLIEKNSVLEAAKTHLRTPDRETITKRIDQFLADYGQDMPDPVIRRHVRRRMLRNEW